MPCHQPPPPGSALSLPKQKRTRRISANQQNQLARVLVKLGCWVLGLYLPPCSSLVSASCSAQGERIQWRRFGALRARARGQGPSPVMEEYGQAIACSWCIWVVDNSLMKLLPLDLLRLPGASFALEGSEDFSWFSCFTYVCCCFGCCKLSISICVSNLP
jgi:hypothetical protein